MPPYSRDMVPGYDIVPVSPSDTATFDLCRCLLITSDGEITIKTEDGTQRGPFNVFAGQYFMVRCTAVMDTGTDCTCAAIY